MHRAALLVVVLMAVLFVSSARASDDDDWIGAPNATNATNVTTNAPTSVLTTYLTDAPETTTDTQVPTTTDTAAPTHLTTEAPTDVTTGSPTDVTTNAPTDVTTGGPNITNVTAPPSVLTTYLTDAPETAATTDVPTNTGSPNTTTDVTTEAPTNTDTTPTGPVTNSPATGAPTTEPITATNGINVTLAASRSVNEVIYALRRVMCNIDDCPGWSTEMDFYPVEASPQTSALKTVLLNCNTSAMMWEAVALPQAALFSYLATDAVIELMSTPTTIQSRGPNQVYVVVESVSSYFPWLSVKDALRRRLALNEQDFVHVDLVSAVSSSGNQSSLGDSLTYRSDFVLTCTNASLQIEIASIDWAAFAAISSALAVETHIVAASYPSYVQLNTANQPIQVDSLRNRIDIQFTYSSSGEYYPFYRLASSLHYSNNVIVNGANPVPTPVVDIKLVNVSATVLDGPAKRVNVSYVVSFATASQASHLLSVFDDGRIYLADRADITGLAVERGVEPAAPDQPDSGKSKSTIIIAAAVGACALVAVVIGAMVCRRRREGTKSTGFRQGKHEEEMILSQPYLKEP